MNPSFVRLPVPRPGHPTDLRRPRQQKRRGGLFKNRSSRMALIDMLELVREGSGELFGTGGFFQQATENYHLPPGCGEGIDRGSIHD